MCVCMRDRVKVYTLSIEVYICARVSFHIEFFARNVNNHAENFRLIFLCFSTFCAFLLK